MLVDSHCHLDFDSFDGERDDVVARARNAGIGHMVTICTKVSEFERIRRIADAYDAIDCSVGVHPHEAAGEQTVTTARLVALARHPKVVGIGETGLDYYYEHSPREAQQRLLRVHIAAARESGLPLIVHTRDADDDMASILAEEMAAGAFTGVLHCFSSSRALAERALALGFYISFSGILTFKNAAALREVACMAPLERLLVETDAPYLAPVPQRGKRNEPAFVTHTAACLAALRKLTPEALALATTDNFYRLFARAKRREAAA